MAQGKLQPIRVWDRGQITIPSNLRRELMIEEGAVVYLQRWGDGLFLRPKESSISAIQRRGEELLRQKNITLNQLIDDEA